MVLTLQSSDNDVSILNICEDHKSRISQVFKVNIYDQWTPNIGLPIYQNIYLKQKHLLVFDVSLNTDCPCLPRINLRLTTFPRRFDASS